MSSPPTPLPLGAAVESLMLQVNSDTVLQARSVMLGEARRLRMALWRNSEGMHIGLCGGDPVSPQASDGFNRRISDLLAHSAHPPQPETGTNCVAGST